MQLLNFISSLENISENIKFKLINFYPFRFEENMDGRTHLFITDTIKPYNLMTSSSSYLGAENILGSMNKIILLQNLSFTKRAQKNPTSTSSSWSVMWLEEKAKLVIIHMGGLCFNKRVFVLCTVSV